MMALPGHLRRRYKPQTAYDQQVLGVYKGPRRPELPPKVTPYRKTLLQAVADGEVKRGQGQYATAWRWHHAGNGITVTKYINEAIRCGWLTVVGAHVELTETGRTALDGAV